MPELAEAHDETEVNPFSHLIPKDIIGGDNGAPAYQVVAGKFSEVPRAEINTPTDYGPFSHLVPANAPSTGGQDYGPFSHLVPVSPTSEAEKALAETPSQQSRDEAAFKSDPLIAAEKGVSKMTNIPIHEAMNTVRVFGAAAGKYIFNGLQGLELNRAKMLAHPTPEMVQPQGDEIILPDGSAMSKEQEAALEQHYVQEAQAGVPDALARAEYFKMRSEGYEAFSKVDPELNETVPARLARTAGTAGVMAMEALIPGVGLPMMVAHGAMATEAEARNAGKSPEEAEAAAVRSAIGLAIFGGASKLAALGVAKLLPQGSEKLTKFIAQFTGQAGANETSSRAIAAWEAAAEAPNGQKVEATMEALKDTTLETTALNTVYALMGASKAAGQRSPVRPASVPGRVAATSSQPVTEPTRGAEPAQPVAARESTADVVPPGPRESRQTEYERMSANLDELNKGQFLPDRSQPEPITPAAANARATEANDWTMATAPAEELLEMVRERIRSGRPIFGNEAMGSTLGAVAPGTGQLIQAQAAIGGAAKRLKGGLTNLEEFHDFRRARLGWSARNQESSGEITRASKALQKAIPDPTRREAITNWIQAGGDMKVLSERAAGSKNRGESGFDPAEASMSDEALLRQKTKPSTGAYRKGYEAAMDLTREELAIANKVRQTYDILRKRAEAHGIEINELDNYVNQIWRRSALKEFGASSNRRLSTNVRFAKKRFHDSFFHGEQAGLRPETKDIAKLLPIYMNEVNNAISAKQFVADMAKGKAQDGRPLLVPRGGGKILESKGGGDKGAVLVFPEKVTTAETGDYKSLGNQPALQAWKWVGEENGKPILMKGDLAVHPEAYSHLKNVLGGSAIRDWYRSPSENPLADIPKAAVKLLVDDVQQIGKATMLGFLSPFHQVQEGTHAIGHKVNPFGGLPKIDMSKPNQRDAARHGLMILPDRVSAQQFREGLDGSSRNLLANALGKFGGPAGRKIKEWSDGYQHYLFHEYIPALKLKTYEHILERNSKRYAKELAGGKATLEQIKFLSAEQSNAAYGHLNYADMGRNPTLQHIAQIFLLAPDFLEARARFAGQAVKGTVTKSGREQLVALGTLAATQWVLARVLNKTLDDDYHFDEPFGVVIGNRKFTMRSVPEDIYKAYQDWRKFTTGRLSPMVGRGLLEGLSGINYRNEPTTIGETFTNILAGMVPLTVQPATRGLTETTRDNPVSPFEQLLGSLGLHVSRFSPTSKVYHLAKEWSEANGQDQKKGLFPRSKYQQLRYALEDGDFDRARTAHAQLVADGQTKIGEGFEQSMLHPFTGSLENDAKFRRSLSADDQKIYDAAVKRRHLILKRYAHMREGR